MLEESSSWAAFALSTWQTAKPKVLVPHEFQHQKVCRSQDLRASTNLDKSDIGYLGFGLVAAGARCACSVQFGLVAFQSFRLADGVVSLLHSHGAFGRELGPFNT